MVIVIETSFICNTTYQMFVQKNGKSCVSAYTSDISYIYAFGSIEDAISAFPMLDGKTYVEVDNEDEDC